MARVESGEWPQKDLDLMMDGFLTRSHERELFGLDDGGDEAEKSKPASNMKSAQGKQLSIDKQVVERLPESEPGARFDATSFDDL